MYSVDIPKLMIVFIIYKLGLTRSLYTKRHLENKLHTSLEEIVILLIYLFSIFMQFIQIMISHKYPDLSCGSLNACFISLHINYGYCCSIILEIIQIHATYLPHAIFLSCFGSTFLSFFVYKLSTFDKFRISQ